MKHNSHIVLKYIVHNVPTITSETLVGDFLNILADSSHKFESITYVYVLEQKQLVGVASLKEIFRAPKNELISKLMKKKIISVKADASLGQAAALAIRHEIKAIPIVSEDDRFLGIITSDSIFRLLHHRHLEASLRRAGIHRKSNSGLEEYSTDEYFKTSIWTSVRSRLPWLIVGLIGGIGSAYIVGLFEHALEEKIILAAFIPLIAYMADAIGTQTETLFVRNIAFDSHMNVVRFLVRELVIGLSVAFICGVLVSLFSVFHYQSPYLGFVLGPSLFVATLFSTIIGTLIPYAICKLKGDPALGTAPLTTIFQDISSVMAYFIIATYMLKFFAN